MVGRKWGGQKPHKRRKFQTQWINDSCICVSGDAVLMSEMGLKQKIILDLFVTPMTLLPAMAGGTLGLFGWAIGSGPLMFVGFMGLLFAGGAGLCRFIFSLEEVTERAAKSRQTKALMAKEAELDALDQKLVRNKDPRDQTYLRGLRTVYGGFVQDLHDDKLSKYVTSKMVSEVNEMFKRHVGLLGYSYEIWDRSRTMDGSLKDTVLEQREEILTEVEKNVEEFVETVTRLRALSFKDGKTEVSATQSQLAKQLEVAERTQEMMKELNSDDSKRFAEFSQEVQ